MIINFIALVLTATAPIQDVEAQQEIRKEKYLFSLFPVQYYMMPPFEMALTNNHMTHKRAEIFKECKEISHEKFSKEYLPLFDEIFDERDLDDLDRIYAKINDKKGQNLTTKMSMDYTMSVFDVIKQHSNKEKTHATSK